LETGAKRKVIEWRLTRRRAQHHWTLSVDLVEGKGRVEEEKRGLVLYRGVLKLMEFHLWHLTDCRTDETEAMQIDKPHLSVSIDMKWLK